MIGCSVRASKTGLIEIQRLFFSTKLVDEDLLMCTASVGQADRSSTEFKESNDDKKNNNVAGRRSAAGGIVKRV